MTAAQHDQPVRLVELVAALSLAADLAFGQPMEHVWRSTLIATRLAEDMGADTATRETTFWFSLLALVGCTADSYELAELFGDDIELRRGIYEAGTTSLAQMRYFLGRAGSDSGVLRRVGIGARLLASGMRPVVASLQTQCAVTSQLALGLGLPDEVARALAHTFARWDGKGVPSGVGGDAIAVPARLLALADVVEVSHRLHGVDAATTEIRGQAGTVLDPDAVEAWAKAGPACVGELPESGVSVWEALYDAAPVAGTRPLTAEAVDAAFGLLGDYADLKSPWFSGHSRAVADLVGAAAVHAGLADADVTMLRRSALLHALGRTGVPNTIWDKRGALSTAEEERMRLHAYYTDRILRSVPGLAGYADLASSSHERLDGSGYPRRISGNDIPRSHRLLAAADAYQTTLEQRPHRAALTEPEAAHRLRAEVTAGRLDGAAVEAVLASAGHRAPRGSVAPAGLTPREVEVLTLVCRGATTREVARDLAIAPKTVSNHIERAYLKIGVNSRAAATLYASRHGFV